MLLCAVLLHGGCGSRTAEETEKVDTTENFDLIGTEGWEYQGEKKQYIYGEWTVTGVRKGDTWDETDEREMCIRDRHCRVPMNWVGALSFVATDLWI